jgi:hypothetical protein
VLIITSSDSPGDRSQAASLGGGYFRKPPSYDEFLNLGPVLRRLLDDNPVTSAIYNHPALVEGFFALMESVKPAD